MGARCGIAGWRRYRRSEASAARLLVPSQPGAGLKSRRGVGPPRSAPPLFSIGFLMYLHIKFDGHEIVVTRPGTDMMTAYRKAPDRPNLILTRSWENPTVISPEISEFRAHAFRAAVTKARKLGWVV